MDSSAFCETVTPLVSVLVATYNQQDTLPLALESILSQQCSFPFEVVVADDGSSDATPDVCREWQARFPEKIRLLLHKGNRGLLANYYGAWRLCRGTFVADCAGDDFWLGTDKLQQQVEILLSHPEVSCCFTDYVHFLPDTRTFLHHRQVYPSAEGVVPVEKALPRLLGQSGRPFLFTGTGCFRRDALIKEMKHYPSFFEGDYPCEDYQLVFFLLRRGALYYIPKETAAYRLTRGTISRPESLEKTFRYFYGVFRLRTDLLLAFSLYSPSCRRFLSSIVTGLLSLSVRLDKVEERKFILSRLRELGYCPTFRVRIHKAIASSACLSRLFCRWKSRNLPGL